MDIFNGIHIASSIYNTSLIINRREVGFSSGRPSKPGPRVGIGLWVQYKTPVCWIPSVPREAREARCFGELNWETLAINARVAHVHATCG